MEKEGLFTTVVGSFPLGNTAENMKKAFGDQIEIGIDYPCYPQLLGMNYQFLSPLAKVIESLEEKEEKFYLSDDFELPDKNVALEYGQFIVDFLDKNPDLKGSIKGTKACLTGPFTLASEVILSGKLSEGVTPVIFKEPRAIMEGWLVDKFADIMEKIGKAYNDMGIEIISMDEPILGLLVGRKIWFHTEEFIIETLNKAISGITGISSLHVCGRISPKLRDILLQTDVKLMDHEFRTNDKNFEIFQKSHFENTDKYLGMGTIETKVSPIPDGKVNDFVEDVQFLKGFIKKGIEQYGRENLVIKPDCGFGPLLEQFGEKMAYEIVKGKLGNLVSALKEIN